MNLSYYVSEGWMTIFYYPDLTTGESNSMTVGIGIISENGKIDISFFGPIYYRDASIMTIRILGEEIKTGMECVRTYGTFCENGSEVNQKLNRWKVNMEELFSKNLDEIKRLE